MATLHAVILDEGGEEDLPSVLLWAEDPLLPSTSHKRGRGRGPATTRAKDHPWGAPVRAVVQLVREVSEACSIPSIRDTSAPDGAISLWLPSSEGSPISSWQAVEGFHTHPTLESWRVPAMQLDLSEAIPWLAGLPVGDLPPDRPRLGPSLRYLSAVAKFTLGLLARQRVLPASKGSGETVRAHWRAALVSDEDIRIEGQFSNVMPPAVRASFEPARSPAASWLLRRFLDSAVDSLARSWLAQETLDAGGKEHPDELWIRALVSREPTFRVGSRAQREELQNGLVRWTAQATEAGNPTAFRACFRLDPPNVEEAEAAVSLFEAPPGHWWLRLFLQARDDPSLLVPARAAYSESRGRLERGGRVLENPQERLLADLDRASRLYPELRRMLNSPRPEACSLTVEEAYQFLRDVAPLLAECGFGVLAPPWWGKARPLSAHVEVVPEDSTGGLFGLNGLVQYDLTVALGDLALSRAELERLAELKVPLVRVRGQWVELKPGDVEAALRALDRVGTGKMTLAAALYASAGGTLEGLPVTQFNAQGALKDLLEGLYGEAKVDAPAVPSGLQGTLRPYQSRGVGWLSFLRRFGLGACLADDMGLGKTIQALTLLLAEKEAGRTQGPWLIACPTSLVTNWLREAQKFAPSLKVTAHHGEERLRGDHLRSATKEVDLVVTTYGVLWRDAKDLSRVAWDTVVLDEAQNIKNPLSKAAASAQELPALHRIALTGTPVENRLLELWSIFEFLNPGFLGNATQFRDRFATPIERFSDPLASGTLHRLVRPFILRRLKSDPAIAPDLPQKAEQKVLCGLTREQATLYEATVRDMMRRIEGASGMQRRALVLSTLTKLKQVCNHPALLLHDRSALPGRSEKLNRLEQMLEEALEEGDRVLIFTQYSEMGEMLRHHLSQVFQIDVPFLHGGTSLKERASLVEQFQASGGPPIFLLSLKAGGLGLNLTAANRVFHFDRWWNPAVENQATDRAYRIGQKRNVLVHKLVVAGTLEERIDLLLERKKGMAEKILGQGEAVLTELSTSELRELFTLRRDVVMEDGPPLPRRSETSTPIPVEG